MSKIIFASCAMTAIFVPAGQAMVQEGEVIIVTAQKRAESLQVAPRFDRRSQARPCRKSRAPALYLALDAVPR